MADAKHAAGSIAIDLPRQRATCARCGAVTEGDLATLLAFVGAHRCAATAPQRTLPIADDGGPR